MGVMLLKILAMMRSRSSDSLNVRAVYPSVIFETLAVPMEFLSRNYKKERVKC
jgi:hypothetical protein